MKKKDKPFGRNSSKRGNYPLERRRERRRKRFRKDYTSCNIIRRMEADVWRNEGERRKFSFLRSRNYQWWEIFHSMSRVMMGIVFAVLIHAFSKWNKIHNKQLSLLSYKHPYSTKTLNRRYTVHAARNSFQQRSSICHL